MNSSKKLAGYRIGRTKWYSEKEKLYPCYSILKTQSITSP